MRETKSVFTQAAEHLRGRHGRWQGSICISVSSMTIKRLPWLPIMAGMTQKKRVMRCVDDDVLVPRLVEVHIIQEKVTRHVDVPRMQFIDNAVDVPVGRPRQVPTIQKTVECIWIWW